MTSSRKYSEALKRTIRSKFNNGKSISELSDEYVIDRRRISEFVKNSNKNTNNENVSMKNNNNHVEETTATVSSNSANELTVEDIMSKNGYSPSEWEVVSIFKNTWDDSKQVTHYQTKITLNRKEINVKVNMPSPIKYTLNHSKPKKVQNNKNIKCAVIIPDMQCGFRRDLLTGELTPIHDREAIDVALQISKYLNPDRIVFLGDNLDLAEMSTKYLTTPDFYFTTQASLVELSWWLAQFRLINENTKIDYIQGNHEKRLSKLINERVVSLYNIKCVNDLSGYSAMSIEKLLGLADLDIESHQYPQGKVALNSNLVCIHGDIAKGSSGATVSEVVKSARVSVIQGHIHRHEIATKTTWDAFNNSHQYTAASFGCLCKIDPGMVPGMKHLQNWQQGIGVVWYEEDGLEQFRMEYIPIIDGRAIYTSEVFEAESDVSIASKIESEMKFKVT